MLKRIHIIYTFGSTGKPKGVQITLGCLESFIKWGLKLSRLKEKDIFMNQAPFFDLSVMDLYLSLESRSTLFNIDLKRLPYR
ncbi:AMP-binding protein [Clostridium sporogenes]|uniref:AMP-binding protein n=1 Tax=Clostridium sporogenes TaxID=1509 RepID=UPI0007801789